ncbi:putative acetyltransferase [archaeon BMS3Abin17]|nr:putative acetyltransferase [archaeon BMS3Abin17]HDZ61326.1 GNAT family N-acetyltransferase [Candidatus Pacearchaeota archaeon]
MKIKKATIKDISKVLELSKEFMQEHSKISRYKSPTSIELRVKEKKKIFEGDIKSGKGAIFLAKLNKKLIGYVFVLGFIPKKVSNTKDFGYISDLYILKEFRKKGLAKELISRAEKWLKKSGYKEISLDVNNFNMKAKRLYNKLGYFKESYCLRKKLK